MEDGHSGSFKIGKTGTRRAKAPNVWHKAAAIEKPGGFNQLALGASYAQFPNHQKNRNGAGKDADHWAGAAAPILQNCALQVFGVGPGESGFRDAAKGTFPPKGFQIASQRPERPLAAI